MNKFVCTNCGKEFERELSKTRRNNNLFCNSDCYREYRIKHPELYKPTNSKKIQCICAHCGIEFEKYPSQLKQKEDGKTYCSQKCYLAEIKSNKEEQEEKKNIRLKKRRDDLYNKVNAIKSDSGCIKCGFNDFRALEFHHRDPSQKIDAIGTMVAQLKSLEIIMAEIAKCDVLCSNCHSILHYEEKQEAK